MLLIDYNRLAHKDYMMPMGRLREPVENSDRADIIIVSKCPEDIKPVDLMTLRKELNPYPFQSLYFSSYVYGNLQPVFSECVEHCEDLSEVDVLAVSAIALAKPFNDYLAEQSPCCVTLSYGDHHFFTEGDYEQMVRKFNRLREGVRVMVVTEKDRARIMNEIGRAHV